MKKNFLVLITSGVLILSACGPSQEEKAAMEKAKQDSIAKAVQDSMLLVQQVMQDSINMAMEKMRQDSIAMADSLAMMASKANKKPSTKPKTPPKEEPKTVGSGKPAMGTPSGTKSDTTIGKGKPKMGQQPK